MKSIARLFAVALCSMACFGGDLAQPISTGELWKGPKQAATNKYLVGARYAPVDDTTWRMANGSFTFGKLRAGEVLLHWGADNIDSLRVIVYSKGDDGAIGKEDFLGRIESAKEALTEITGVEPKKKKVNVKETGVQVECWEWSWENGAARLDASYTGELGKKAKRGKKNRGGSAPFEAEFIRVDLGPDAAAIEHGGASDKVTRKELRSSIKKEEDGTVWLEGVNMVDQGQKGYCVPATLARVFAFYGMDGVDQHALAALCDSSADGGTSSNSMEGAMAAICKKFPVKLNTIEDYQSSMMALVEPYNKLAKKKGKQALSFAVPPMDVADPELLKQVRAGKKSQVKKWLGLIKRHIDAGSPVLWSVTLGIYREEIPVPQSRGGHMRLIIGYNMKEQTIIYSDSWGAGHEKKTMPAAEAAAMTTGRYVIKLK
ncbi:MAG: hypothetical protein E7033_05620 [Akkermansiaceae bacterium]|nr:hypothetical protein [Akkermansiaceae bacterium]